MRKYQKNQVTASAANEDHAMQYALFVLGFRQRTEKEMRQRLEGKGYTPEVTDRTLATLTRIGLLDDREFTRCWITSRTGRGRTRIKQELQQKGIDRDLAEEMIRTGISADEEFISALDVAKRAVRTMPMPLERANLVRLQRLLQRRGFSFDIINRVCAGLSDYLSAEGDWLE